MVSVFVQVRSEYAMQAVQELVERMTDKCFHKCTTKSGKKLESKVRHRPLLPRLYHGSVYSFVNRFWEHGLVGD